MNELHRDADSQKSTDGGMTPEQTAQFAELLKEKAGHVVSKLPLLGAITWLMMQQNTTRHTLISELEWRVMPPLVLGQTMLYMRQDTPLAYVSWARLSDATAERYKSPPHHLASGDWKSGEQNWIVDLCTPFGGASDIIGELCKTVFKGQALNQVSAGPDGKLTVITWPPLPDDPLA